jgi:hypothetical protein
MSIPAQYRWHTSWPPVPAAAFVKNREGGVRVALAGSREGGRGRDSAPISSSLQARSFSLDSPRDAQAAGRRPPQPSFHYPISNFPSLSISRPAPTDSNHILDSLLPREAGMGRELAGDRVQMQGWGGSSPVISTDAGVGRVLAGDRVRTRAWGGSSSATGYGHGDGNQPQGLTLARAYLSRPPKRLFHFAVATFVISIDNQG